MGNAKTHSDILDSFFEALNAHDAEKAVSLMTSDCVFESASGSEVYGTRYSEREGVKAAFENVWKALPDVRWDLSGHLPCDNTTVSTWVFRATRPDGTRIAVQGCDIFLFRDQKISTRQTFRKEQFLPK